MVQRSTAPYREQHTDAMNDDKQHTAKLLYEGPLYGPSDPRHSDKMSDECRVRVVRTFVQQVDNDMRKHVVQRNEVEVTLGRDALGWRVWRPASELRSNFADAIIDAVASGVVG